MREFALKLGLAISLAFANQASADAIKTDFVFLIDATSSMAGEIAGVRSGFSSFVSGLDSAAVDARFAVILYGGAPELVLDFTSSGAEAQTALNTISASSGNNAVAGFQNNHNVNPEAGLEVIRMALGAATNNDLIANNVLDTPGATATLDFRTDARINLILATDEDSDCPFYAVNAVSPVNPGDTTCVGNTGANNNNGLLDQAEVDATAQAIIDKNAYVNMLINRGDTPSRSVYGDYLDDVSDPEFLNFDAGATLTNLKADTVTDESLQAQVLEAGLIARTFNIAGANDANFVNNFFAAKLEEVITDPCIDDPFGPTCGPNPVPLPAAAWLFGSALMGIAGMGYRRKKKA